MSRAVDCDGPECDERTKVDDLRWWRVDRGVHVEPVGFSPVMMVSSVTLNTYTEDGDGDDDSATEPEPDEPGPAPDLHFCSIGCLAAWASLGAAIE